MSLQKHLEGLVSTANQIMTAIESKSELQASVLSLKFRQQKTDLLREKDSWDHRRNRKSQHAVSEDTAKLATVIDSFEDELAVWRTRPASENLFDDEQKATILVDGFLPASWDFARDVAVLVGNGLEKFAHALRNQGQSRILVYRGAGDSQEAFPAGTLFAEENVQAAQLVQFFVSPIAKYAVSKQRLRDISIDEHRELMKSINTGIVYAQTNLNTAHLHGSRWVTQGLTNLSHLVRSPSIQLLDGAFEGKPFVLVAPGPSLEKNIGELHKLQGHAIIAAFSHSLPPLHKAGIHVDFVFVVDSMDVRYHFEGSDVSQVGALLSTAMVEPGLFELGFERCLTFSSSLPLEGWAFEGMDSVVELCLGGSVATAAMQAALRWKCDPIICVGLDLSFPGGRTYVRGSSDEEQTLELHEESNSLRIKNLSDGWLELRDGKEMSEEICHMLPALGGGEVPTNGAMFKYFMWFSDIAAANKGSVRMLNCTEGGCVIPDMEHVPLSRAIEECKSVEIDVSAILEKRFDEFDADAQLRAVMTRTIARARELGKVIKLARECLKLQGKRPQQLSRRYAKCEQRLRSAMSKTSYLSLMSDAHAERLTYDSPSQMEANWFASNHLIFAILSGAEEAMKALKGTIQRMEQLDEPSQEIAHAS